MKKKILLILVIVFIGIQFVPVAYNTANVVPTTDFIVNNQPPTEVAQLIKNSCYDCHSNNTRYPWYDKIAPVSWWVQDHVDHGKEEMNFSAWTEYPAKKQKKYLKEIIEEVEEGEMPLESYLIMHGNAKVNAEQLAALESWIETITVSE
ncbi:hypothetical protein KH5_24090 [Urechidicola sp. KH5]